MNHTQTNYLHVKQLLSKEQVQLVSQLMETAAFKDGVATATSAASKVKKNLQIRSEDSLEAQQIGSIVMQAISQCREIQAAVMPKMILPPLISKYEENMSYGLHVDSPLMGSQYTIRTDVGMTLFLSDPQEYEGGELLVMTESGEKKYKLPAGDAIMYPTTRLHEVLPVTSGVRKAVITWIQSAVRDPFKRDILRNLSEVAASLNHENSKDEQLTVQQVYSNLVRMWAEL